MHLEWSLKKKKKRRNGDIKTCAATDRIASTLSGPYPIVVEHESISEFGNAYQK
jgi:hypothetical protein